MTGAQIEVASAVVGALVLIYTTIRQVRKEAKAAATADANEKQDIYNRGVTDGRASRDDEIALVRSQGANENALLRSQRDDARNERDDERRQKAELEKEMRAMLRQRRPE